MRNMCKFLCLVFTLLIFVSSSSLDSKISKDFFLQELLAKEGPACPVFTCEKKIREDNKCFTGTGKEEEGTRKTFINKCDEQSYCDVKDFFRNDDVTCKKLGKTDDDTINFKGVNSTDKGLPGEKCINIFGSTCEKVKITKPNSDEIIETNECKNDVCVGNKSGEKCESMESCVIGTYCDGYDIGQKTLGTCKYYRKDGDLCKDTAECGFKSVCGTAMEGDDKGKKKCTKIGSFKLGQEVTKNEEILCESGTQGKDTDDKYKCAVIMYDTDKELINNEVVECEKNSQCNYKYRFSNAIDKDVKDEKLKKKCQCSFDGKGYCPFANGVMKNRFYYINKAKTYVEPTESQVHSLHRHFEVFSLSLYQYGTNCRTFYESTLSYNSGICPSITNEYGLCTYIKSSIISISITSIFVLIFGLLLN